MHAPVFQLFLQQDRANPAPGYVRGAISGEGRGRRERRREEKKRGEGEAEL